LGIIDYYSREVRMTIAIEVAGGRIRLVVRNGLPLAAETAAHLLNIIRAGAIRRGG
jgi:hypothetical protein